MQTTSIVFMLIVIMPELMETYIDNGYYGCSEQYLQKYYSNTKMCEILLGDKEYNFKNNNESDFVAIAKKVIDYIKNKYTFGKRVCIVHT